MAGQKIRIKLKAYDHNLIDASCAKIVDAAQSSREQFELRTHKRLIDIYNSSARTVDSLMKLDLPAGVDIQIKL